MIVFRFLAYLLILAGIGLLGHGVVGMLQNGGFEPVPFAQMWLWIRQVLDARHQPFPRAEPSATDFHQSVLIPYFWSAAAYAVFLVPGVILLAGWCPARDTRAVGIGRRRSGTGRNLSQGSHLKIEY